MTEANAPRRHDASDPPVRTHGATGRRAGRSQAAATWLALLGGSLGLHRFYLYGARDALAWLHPGPTLVGAYGLWRLRTFGVDDARGSLLVLLLGAMLAATMLQAIVYGLTSQADWRRRHGAAPDERREPPRWTTVLAVVAALAIGATVAIATIAFAAQRWFETQSPSAAAPPALR